MCVVDDLLREGEGECEELEPALHALTSSHPEARRCSPLHTRNIHRERASEREREAGRERQRGRGRERETETERGRERETERYTHHTPPNIHRTAAYTYTPPPRMVDPRCAQVTSTFPSVRQGGDTCWRLLSTPNPQPYHYNKKGATGPTLLPLMV